MISMLHMGRCGSTVLAHMLRQHDIAEIEWDGEIFERQFNGDLIDNRTIPPLVFLRKRIARSQSRLFGFETKCHPDQHLAPDWIGLSIAAYIDSLYQLGFTDFILLQRRNYLRQLVSFYMGWQRGWWHLPAGEQAPLSRVVIDPAHCRIAQQQKPIRALFEELDETYQEIKQALQPQGFLALSYEDDIAADPTVAYRKVAARIGLRPIEPQIPFTQSNPFALHDVIANYDKIVAALVDTPYEWMLELPVASPLVNV